MASTPITIRRLQRKLYSRSKQEPGQRFYSLYDKLQRDDILEEAYARCKANKGGAGVDGVTFDMLERGDARQQLLADIKQRLQQGNYQPQPVMRVEIPKDNGKIRRLGVPVIADRIVQMAMTLVMQPIFEPHLHSHSYGYRPKRNAQQAIRWVDMSLKQGYRHVLDADLSGYFDSIPHAPLMQKVSRRISDNTFLGLLRRFIKAPISIPTEKGKQRLIANHIGTPQGGSCSPLLALIYLNDFCLKIHHKTPCRIVTYADDFVVLHKQPFTNKQLAWLTQQLAKEGLTLNPEKTHCVDMGQRGSEFDFLGYQLKRVKGYYRGTSYIKVQPSKKSQEKLKNTLRDIVKHRTSHTLDVLVERVNRVLRGWKNYFGQIGYPRQVFFKMDWFLVARFYRWSRSRSQRRSLYLSRDTWDKLRKAGLEYLQPVRVKTL
jgi:group II intron reverse transcriptase/maturase